MPIFTMFLLVLGLVLFFLGAIGVPNPSRYNLVSAGLFCWLLSEIVTRVPLH